MSWTGILANSSAAVWLVLMVLFLTAEAVTPWKLVSIWFAAGALAAMFAALLGGNLWVQIALFLAVSAAFLLLLRPLFRHWLVPEITPTNVDSVLGSTGVVSADVSNVNAAGRVKLGAMDWTARSTSGEDIPAGALVRVDRVEGVKVFVTPVKVPEKSEIE